MSDLLAIGASGVRAYQGALTTTSENIANAGVEGYAKRSARLAEVGAASGSYRSGAVNAGMGVTITGIARSADAYKTAAVRTAGTDLARTESASAWLGRIQGALTGNQLTARVTGFFTAASTLAADPTSSAARTALLESATTAAGAFSATGRALDQVAADLDSTADQGTAALNRFGAALAKVNDGLARTAPDSAAAASLADQRDQLLEQMSTLVDVTVTTDSIGRATVKLGDASGAVFVSGTSAGAVTYARDADKVTLAMFRDGVSGAVLPNGGALGGIVDGAKQVADARAALNTIAGAFTTDVNAFQARGQTLGGGAPPPKMFDIAPASVPTEFKLSLTNPDDIAAASVGGGPRDGSNLATLQASRAASGVEGRTTTLVANNAAAIEQRKLVADAQSAIRDGAVSARDSVSGVNLDTEAVDLLRFQQAYQASSKVIQVARDIFQTIIGIN
ncbi:flagellar hook-associated protein FlgK [Sphingomonas sp.]|uniref:flagellar hook-associated protein FlgK n=1 Tax=Sphingomonas sp. TaxID=28214 RepID=UPI0035BC2CC0